MMVKNRFGGGGSTRKSGRGILELKPELELEPSGES
jgi:hypothetical protein